MAVIILQKIMSDLSSSWKAKSQRLRLKRNNRQAGCCTPSIYRRIMVGIIYTGRRLLERMLLARCVSDCMNI